MLSLVLVTLFACAAALSIASIALTIKFYRREVMALRIALKAEVPLRDITWQVREPARSLSLPEFVSLRAPRTTYRRLSPAVTVQSASTRALRAA